MVIKIEKKFLIFREEAKKIEKEIKKKLKKVNFIWLDFSNVEFISRSFFDELVNIMAREKRIKILNLKPDLKKFFNKVKKTKQEIFLFAKNNAKKQK